MNLAGAWTGGDVPGAGDTGVIKHWGIKTLSSVTWASNLIVKNGGRLYLTNGARDLNMGTNADLTLTGTGQIYLWAGQTIDLNGNDLVLNSGLFLKDNSGDGTITDGFLKGSGSITLTGEDPGSIVITDSVNTTGFTGAFNLTSGSFELAAISSANASFDLTISGTGVYDNAASVAFTSLTIDGNAVAADTYTRAALLTYGTTEYGADWSGFIADGGASITVIPEPGTCALIGGLLALTSVMIRRRRS